jgi:hypothetical protein
MKKNISKPVVIYLFYINIYAIIKENILFIYKFNYDI